MKNTIRGLLALALVLVLPVITLAMGTTNNGYNDPILYDEFQFEAVLNGDQVDTNWNVYAPDGFNYYKVVRSTNDPDPVYPDDGYIQVTSDPDFTTYTDKDVPGGVSYYRVCSIVKPDRFCSNVVMIEKGEGEPVPEQFLDEAFINLDGGLTGAGIELDWDVDGPVPHGFKVISSTSKELPTYPGNSATYLSDPGARNFVHKEVYPGKTYHFRVCQYNGEVACASYSNAVHVTIPWDYKKDEPVPEKDIPLDEYHALKAEIAALKEKVAQLEVFVDVQTHKYETAIDYLREQGIVQGYDDGSYKPDIRINRAEFMKIVMGEKYGDELSSVQADCFIDVGKEWYAAYICLGKAKGVVSGYGNNYFKPGDYISFVEAAKILANVYGLDLGDEGLNWYEKYVHALQNEGYIPSTIGELAKPITRAEMAELIWRIKEQKKNQDKAELIFEPVKVNEGDFAGWQTYEGSDFRFYHPGWYQGEKWGRVVMSEEKDYIDNLHVQNYMAVDTYINVYDVAGDNLVTDVWFEHPLASSQEVTVNGVTGLKRHFRAPRGTVVNDRTTGENENILVYSFLVNNRVVVLMYFNAHGTENKDVEVFEKIASSFSLK